jgi:hypothetical protein
MIELTPSLSFEAVGGLVSFTIFVVVVVVETIVDAVVVVETEADAAICAATRLFAT